MATEITVENIDPEAAPEEILEPPPEPPALVRQAVSFATSAGEEISFEVAEEAPPAPKKRGRPKAAAPKPKAEPKRRGRPPKQQVVAEPVEPVYQEPIDINALLEPLFQAYMATSHMSRQNAKQQQYRDLFEGMRVRM